MRGIIFAILMLTQLTACAAAAPKQAAAREYRSAIESAEIQEGYDRRYEFHRCIRNWEIAAPDLAVLKGRAYSGAMDAPCYFLSLRKGTSSRSVAIYGSLGAESADSLIKELLAAVGKPRAEPLLP